MGRPDHDDRHLRQQMLFWLAIGYTVGWFASSAGFVGLIPWMVDDPDPDRSDVPT